MASIDITAFLEQCGIRKARFGGLEPEDVRLALEALAAEYEAQMNRVEAENRRLLQDNAGLEKHAKGLSAQVRLFSEQNMNLAKSNEGFTRQLRDLSAQNAALKEKNRSLNDQNQLLLLKNHDLERSNVQLRAAAEKAETELAVRGKQLDETRRELQQKRDATLTAAKNEAGQTLASARRQAEDLLREANDTALAIQQTALKQARKQAHELVENATNEANEVNNVQQLRLNSLRAEVAEMEKRRAALLDYLIRMGSELLNMEQVARAADPDAAEASELPGQMELELQHIDTPEVELDLTPETVARTAAELAEREKERELRPEPAVRDLPWTGPDDLEQPRRSYMGIRLEEEPAPERELPAAPQAPAEQVPAQPAEEPVPEPQHAAPGEIPGAPVGAIFSMPIVHQSEPVPAPVTAEPPKNGPRMPLLPTLDVEDEDEGDAEPEMLPMPDDLPELPSLPDPVPEQEEEPEEMPVPKPAAANPAPPKDTPARRRALRAVQALRRMRRKP